MKKKRFIDYRKVTFWTLVLMVFPTIPAFASIQDYAVKGFNAVLNSIATGIASWMFKYLQLFIMNSTDLSKLGKNIDFYIGYSQALGIALVGYFTVQKFFINFIKAGMGENVPPPAKILGKAVVSGVMTVSVHYLLDILIGINNGIVKDIVNIGLDVNRFKSMFTAPADLLTGSSDFAILFLILVICGLILAVIGGIRYAEIAFLYIIAPVLMAGDTATSLMGNFFKTAIGIIFTQAVQIIGIGLLISAIMNLQGPDQLFISIGFLVVLMRGSKTLREYLYSSGTGDGLSSAGSMAAGMLPGMMARGGALKSLGGAAAANVPGLGGMASKMTPPSSSSRTGSFTSR